MLPGFIFVGRRWRERKVKEMLLGQVTRCLSLTGLLEKGLDNAPAEDKYYVNRDY